MINRREFCLAIGAGALSLERVIGSQSPLFVAKTYQNRRQETMPYRLFIPGRRDGRGSYPLVLWLHGSAGRGTDNLKQISGGNTSGSQIWTSTENQSKHPCFVVAPQCPENESWADGEKVEPTKQLGLVVELLGHLQRMYRIDHGRLYVAGQSMGGFGTWSIITQSPEMFAAAIPICGGGDQSQAGKLVKMPIWAFHGEKDEAVRVERSRKMIDALKRAGGTPKYTEYEGAGHVIWDRVFSEPELLPWIFAQNRAPKKRNKAV